MKKKQHKIKATKRIDFADIPLWMCIFFIALGSVLGSIFAYNCLYLNQLIDREEAVAATGIFDSYRLSYGKGGAVNEVRIRFIDRSELYLNTAAYHVEMDEKLEALEKGQRLDMLLHPNSQDVWELKSDNEVILSFDDAKSRIRLENGLYFVLVGLCLIGVFIGSFALFSNHSARRKKRQKIDIDKRSSAV